MSAVQVKTPHSEFPNFDAQKSPVLGVDVHLPAVPAASLSPSSLRYRFANPPLWRPELLAESRFVDSVPVLASVLVPIVIRQRPTVMLTRRTHHMSTHSGQIAFPGGKWDKEDLDPVMTALREANEEVGLESEYVQVLGSLPTYLTGSSFNVTPVVALVRDGFSVVCNSEEVDEVFEVPLEFLMNPANHQRHSFEWEGGRREWMSMPYRRGRADYFIWGVTAGILRNFYRFLSA